MEGWVDPNSQQDETTKPEADTVTSPMDATPPVATPQMVKPPVATPPPPQPVICKKGKCQPYDPAKDKVRLHFRRVLLVIGWKTALIEKGNAAQKSTVLFPSDVSDKAELLQEGIFFLIYLFARDVLVTKKLEIEKN